MKRFTIQARLTAWYLLSSAIIVALFAGGSWLAMKASMYHSVDRDLSYRVASVVPFIESHSLNTPDQFARVFTVSSDSSVVGVFVQITDAQSRILYVSDILSSHHVPVLPAGPEDGSISVSTAGGPGWPVRYASQRIVVDGIPLTVHVVEPLRDLMSSLREYSLDLALLIPFALLLTTTVGYLMSRRALAPVEQIRQQAQAIDPADLTTRLQVPPTDDELARLAQTLNAMLSRIETSFHSIEQFTADASHELRTPLALITTAAEVSLRRERSREELAEVLGKVVREARHMSRLIDNLLDLARGDARRHPPQLAPTGITTMLRDLSAELSASAAAKGLTLDAVLPDNEVQVPGDGTELRRLFLILLDNAIKYTEAGSVRIALGVAGANVTVTIADTGIGIEPAALDHIFDRFWRADKVRSRAEGGAGLGLSLASQIVQQHGGSISVESEPGHGSTFTVSLSKAPAPQNS
jgi:two-component system, OmpR family, heavy metal sensor histidine kinase CusS